MNPRPPLLTASFLLLVSAHFLEALGYASMILLPLYLDWLGASRTEVGLIMGIAAVGGLLSRPMVGWSLDRFGRKPTLGVGTLILAGGMGLLGLVTTIGPLVYLARILIGVGIGVLFTGYFTLASDVVPEVRRTEGLALFGISGLVPLVVNPLAGRMGIAPPELRWFFLILAGVVLSSLVFLAPVREPPNHADRPPTASETWEALRRRSLLPVWLASVVFAGLVAVYMAFATVTAEARGVADPTVLWGTYAVGAIGIRLLGAQLPDRVGPSRIVAPAILAYIAGVLLTAWSHEGTGFAIAGFLAGIGHGFTFPVLASQVATRSPTALRGSAMAAFTALWDFAALVFVPMFGWFADLTNDGTMLSVAAATALVGLVGWVGLERWAVPAREEA
ncbi:MAG: MFS transporter [Deltaproteobacteria bacterium]|nr:MFS transporter [Deltaproteobacteria bacterium]